MSKSRTRYRQPTRKEEVRINFAPYKLGELFNEKALADFMAVARFRVIGEFYFAVDYRGGRLERTENYIIGVGRRVSDLAMYVTETMHHQIIQPNDLPRWLTSDQESLNPRLLDRVIKQATFDIMSLVVAKMRNSEMWYDEATGVWQIQQSSVDEFVAQRRQARGAASVKRDDPSFHGRVRSQSERRGTPPGTSIGLS